MAEVDAQRLVDQLYRLVDTYGPTFAEAPVLEVFEEILDEARLPYFRQSLHEDEDRYNLIVTVGPEPVGLMWVGHVDTVALHDDEQREVTVEDGCLWGLGAADMKGPCVAAIEALRLLDDSSQSLGRGVRLALVVGEEEYGDGAERLLEEFSAPEVLIGEPTSLVPCTAHYGYFEVALRAVGERAHAALPEVGHNAIHGLLSWLQELFATLGTESWAERCAVTLRRIDGGTPLFAVPERCEAVLDVHLGPGLDFEHFEVPLRRALGVAVAEHSGVRFEHELLYGSPGFESKPSLLLGRAFERAEMAYAPAPFRSHSDGALFHAAGMITSVCGPGALEVAHRPDEHIRIEELLQAVRLYHELFAAAAAHAEP